MMENTHSPAAQRALRIRADRQRIRPHIDLVRRIAAGKPPAEKDVYHVRIALLLARREEARADDLPTATLNLLSELSREAAGALRRILLAVAGQMGPLAQSQNWDALLAEIGHGESPVWKMLREAAEHTPAPPEAAGTDPPADPVHPQYLGDGRVRIGDETVCLEGNEADIVETLVTLGAANIDDLRKVADNVPRVLNRIREKYPVLAPHIISPGAKGRGGYRTTIADGRRR